jgi:signal recognition particle subunit SRP54
MFESLTDRFDGIFSRLRGKGRLSESDVDEVLREVRLALLEADVNVSVARALLDRVRERAVGAEVMKSLTPGQQIIKLVNESLMATLGDEAVPLNSSSSKPTVILMAGLQGSGKTTSTGKLARLLKEDGKKVLLVAADLQRPAAVEQLQQLGERVGVSVFADQKTTPVRLVKGALKHAQKDDFDVMIVDTAGRLQVDDGLMKELADIRNALDPDEVLLVVDAMTGQDAVNVAQGFLEHTKLTGVILSKLDGDARGGAAISVREVTGCPIKFAGIGEGLDQFEVFHPERMASRILGMGDVLTLIEKAEKAFDEDEAEEMAKKLIEADFTLDDFLKQFQQLRKMGSIGDLLGMIPGARSAMSDVEVSDRDIGRVEAIIRSMTPNERVDSKLINASRKRRIAVGSGTSQNEVSGLLRQFGQAQKMMQSFSQGKGMPGLPNIPGMPKNAIPGNLPGGKPPKLGSRSAPTPRASAKQPRTAKKSQKKKKK